MLLGKGARLRYQLRYYFNTVAIAAGDHRMDATTALECLKWFQADLQRECNRPVAVLSIMCDNVPFDSDMFKQGCASWPSGPHA